MADAWSDIQALQQKSQQRQSSREKLKKRKQFVLGIQGDLSAPASPVNLASSSSNVSLEESALANSSAKEESDDAASSDAEIERHLLNVLFDYGGQCRESSDHLTTAVGKVLNKDVQQTVIDRVLQKLAAQGYLSLQSEGRDGQKSLQISNIDYDKVTNVIGPDRTLQSSNEPLKKRLKANWEENGISSERSSDESPGKNRDKEKENAPHSLESLLSMRSAMEREKRKMGDEILDLLSKPTAREKSMQERFRSVGGAQVQEFCQHGTRVECMKESKSDTPCNKLHFRKIINKHTDESIGDCSFLNTCFHMDTCKYVHYEVDYSGTENNENRTEKQLVNLPKQLHSDARLHPPEWLQCDLRYFDMSVLGHFSVIMADPPWDIHMELPYGTMSDDEMRQLNIPAIQEEGFIFLWVTGRAMELGRECLKLWGYERCDEIIWVKTNQLQRIIRTGRTGHWLNHGKEHCLVGVKGDPKGINKGLDCDVIVAEVRATSHKPDEIYGIIERLSPGTRKIELFGREHNIQPNWLTLGNQLDGVRIVDEALRERFFGAYPDGCAMMKR